MLLRQGGIDLEHGMAWQPIGHFYLFANNHNFQDMRVSNKSFELSLRNVSFLNIENTLTPDSNL